MDKDCKGTCTHTDQFGSLTWQGYQRPVYPDWIKRCNGMEWKDCRSNLTDEHRCNGLCDNDFGWGDYARSADSPKDDLVNNPMHYTVGGYEAKDVMKAKLTPEEWRGACKANVLKYLMRANYKSKHDQDIEKAAWYMKELVLALECREVRDEVEVRDTDLPDPPF